MATDWSSRTAALAYFEKHLKWAKQANDDSKEMLEAVVNALRRSQDHTAIQNRLKVMSEALAQIKDMTDANNPESYRSDDREGCLDTVFAKASEALAPSVGKPAEPT